ncbi:S1 RNA-binding domain-containing protein 1 isoform X2 [Tribolium madens]|uniref:S1 RNA-binding domain-containing protein 1 isoform X2 n=1 Tax=Tribolium madens TaxID=41895 RepID=UPI001CF7373A|nr:S1 RNA-binding domain-containing protein 1 isoform X2 [Tribolium madens]
MSVFSMGDSTRKRKLVSAKTSAKKPKTVSLEPQWSDYELLAEQLDLGLEVAKNIVKLFEEGNTVPFIARYRRDVTNNLEAEQLRAVKDTCDEITALRGKIGTVLRQLDKSEVLTEELRRSIVNSRSIEELEYIYAPYKSGSKGTLAERAKQLGLEEPALALLNNTKRVKFEDFVNEGVDFEGVRNGIIHIIASVISTDTEILASLRELRKKTNIIIKTKKAPKAQPETSDKFDNYFDFEIPVKKIKPHQVLAINRGENLKILTVKVVLPEWLFTQFRKKCDKWANLGGDNVRQDVLKRAIEDSYNRLVEPLIKREIRAELKQNAERASCQVFSTNLKDLLLAPPWKGQSILGLDPGFANGCKLALISPLGTLVDSNVIYPHKTKREKDVTTIKRMLIEHKCELIALGNGTACRQTEEWLSNLIKSQVFSPLDVKYTVVREEGASIYSCSPEAKKEFPTLDPNIISAVSLARRVQDPLAELVKIEPQHLGVGMYQHDIKKKQLGEALNDVVSECVSFVGVDLNTASRCLLRHVAGLSEKKAQQIIDYRTQNGPFICRKQLLEVSGIGQKIFTQCAGFVRVGPPCGDRVNDFYKNVKSCKLDCTNIHPESYEIATKLLKMFNFKLSDVGTTDFINRVKGEVPKLDLSELSQKFHSNEQTLRLILDAFCQPLNYDFRIDCDKKPVFKKGLIGINDLQSGIVLTGVVTNVTHFGSFVDIGVGINGLIHVSKSTGLDLHLGNKVEVKVISIDVDKKRIGLQALKILD